MILKRLYTEPVLKKQGEKMKHEDNLEEVEFWRSYINKWEVTHNKPVPERVQLLLDNAVLKLEVQFMQSSKFTVH